MRMIQFLLVALIVFAIPALGQLPAQQTIDAFDQPDSLYLTALEGGVSSIVLTKEGTDKQEGTEALRVTSLIDSLNPWGSFTQFEWYADSGVHMDWAISDSLSIWIKVLQAPANPQYMVMRLHLVDQPSFDGEREDFLYENTTIFDAASGWVNLKIPLNERESDGSTIPNDQGFVYAPTNWGGFTYNNKKLDTDKIVGYKLSIVTTGWAPSDGLTNIPMDSIDVLFDDFTRFGLKAVPAVFFNGKAVNANMTSWAWGQSSVTVEENAGPLPKTNAINWTQGNEWGNGWSGIGWDISPTFNLAGAWQQDSVKIKIKAESGVGAMRMQFESSDSGKVGVVFSPTADGAWHDYVFALKDMTVMDGAPHFDSSSVYKLGMMAEGTAVAGKVVYITDWWTGSPEFDVIPPDAPTGISVTGGAFQNLITWTDTPNEPGAKYNVYFSENAFTSVDDAGVGDIPLYNLPAGTGSHTHLLRAPGTDQAVSYFYGVMATDESGNESPLLVSSTATTTTAKGVPTINKTAPANFVADGDLSEWAGMTYILLSKDSLTAHVTPNMTIDNDADLSAKAYIAFDADYLYVAFDVTDDIVSQNSGNSYEKDAPDLFIGLYDWRGRRHSGYKGGATPDYHFRFNHNEMFDDNGGVAYLRGADSVDYAYVEKVLTSGYFVEAKLSLDSLAAGHTSGDAARFHPEEGKRLPIDFSINDNDGSSREGILAYSVFNDDNSWQNMYNWTYTWIGDLWRPTTSVEQTDATPRRYELSQNFPNPFNPTTQIRYSLQKAGQVTLRVYDLVGREVATLVDTHQEAGSYTATFSTREITGLMSTGVYFYRLDAGEFTSIKKMVLLK